MTGSRSQNRWALCIGINAYPMFAPQFQLQGCANDAQLIAEVLQGQFGFPEANVRLLLDAQATRERILAEMDALARSAEPDDVVVLQYSGHGSQMTDREGDDPDGLDETIVPHDSGRAPHPNRDITDDEVFAWLDAMSERTRYVTLLFDCCHSGTISRDLFGTRTRWLPPDTRPAEQLPPSPLAAPGAMRSRSRDVGPSGWLPLSERYVLMAGARDDESANEYQADERGALVHGALTYFLARELVNARSGATYRDVFSRAGALVTAEFRRQHPQLEGARDREVFGVREIAPKHVVLVTGRQGAQVTLGGGLAHGLTVGSSWAVEAEANGLHERVGLVKIERVGAVTASGRVEEEVSAAAVAAGLEAVEELHSFGQMRLSVAVQAPPEHQNAADQMAEQIARSPLLRTAEPLEGAAARAYAIWPRQEARAEDPVPQLGAVVRALWAVVGLDGRLLMPTRPVGDGAIAAICRNLEQVARFRQALALRNPDPSSSLRDSVDLVLKRRVRGGGWMTAEPQDAGGQVVFCEGERIAIEIVNQHTAPLYASVLDFGLTGAISLLYPVAGSNEPIAAGRSLQIGVREGDELELYLPDTFPYRPDPNDRLPEGGTETFKLIATASEADLTPLMQEGVRSSAMRPSATGTVLRDVLELAMTGRGTRAARRNRLPANEEWTTVERSFFLRRGVGRDSDGRHQLSRL